MYTIFINNHIFMGLTKLLMYFERMLTLRIIHCNKCVHGLYLVGIFAVDLHYLSGLFTGKSTMVWLPQCLLTHWGRMTHICVGKLTILDSDNGLSPGRLQAIIWTNAGILLIGPLGTNFSESLIGIQTFSLTKIYLKMLSAKWRPFCLGRNRLHESNELMI